MSSRWGRGVPAESCPKWISPTAATRITGYSSRDLLHPRGVAHGGDRRLVVDVVVGEDLGGHGADRLLARFGGHLAGQEHLVAGHLDLDAHLRHAVVGGQGVAQALDGVVLWLFAHVPLRRRRWRRTV